MDDVDPKETSDEAADEDVEQADGDVENGCDRRAREAFSCFLLSITRDEGDKVGEIGAEDEDCAISSGLTSSSAEPVATAAVGDDAAAACRDDDRVEPTLALELVLRGLSDFLNRMTAAVEGPSALKTPSALALLLLLCEESLAWAPLI